MRVALVHDWLTGMRGGEKVLDAFLEVFPAADVFTLVHVKGSVSPRIEGRPIRTSFLQRLPFSPRRFRIYLPLFPAAVESLDLSGYDLAISTSHCVAKGILPPPGTRHLCYCFTPMRYVWDQRALYLGRGGLRPLAPVTSALSHYLRLWDAVSAARVHKFTAISRHVASRIRNFYGREADVLYPPVDDGFYVPDPSAAAGEHYLVVSALAPYKRVEDAIRACRSLGRTLRIIGTGAGERRLRRLAGRGVEFLGWRDNETLRREYAACRALLFPGEEDFGIVPLEAMACGRPVIAYGRGGARETVAAFGDPEPPTGVLYAEPGPEPLEQAIRAFEAAGNAFSPEACRARAVRFGRARFLVEIRQMVDRFLAETPRP